MMPNSTIPTKIIEPKKGCAPFDLKQLWNYRDLFYFLTKRDINVRYKQIVQGDGINAYDASLLSQLPIRWSLLGLSKVIVILIFLSCLFYFRMWREFYGCGLISATA